MSQRVNPLHPFTVPLGEGQVLRAGGLLLLQASLVFWPLAIRLARRQAEARGVQRMLDDLSDQHKAHIRLPPFPTKRFRAKEKLRSQPPAR